MRLFVALDIDDNIRERICRFLDGVREFAPDARWVRVESLHVTLKFIGEQPEAQADKIKGALRAVAAESFEMNIRDYGFFPTASSPRVFWIGIEAGEKVKSLAATVDSILIPLGLPQEEHAFNPHLTLARSTGGSGAPHKQKADRPNRGFQRLQERLAEFPAAEFGTMTAREFFLYQSQLSRGGSKYTKLAGFPLR